MDENLIKEGMTIDLEYGAGTIIYKTKKDGVLYINVAFGNDTLEDAFFKVYSVDFSEDSATFNEVKNDSLYQELAAEWIADDMVEMENK